MQAKGKAPACFALFEAADDKPYDDFVREYREKGYDHIVSASSSSDIITCGTLDNEYRHAARSALLFRGAPPQWDVLAAGNYSGSDPVVVVEIRKFTRRTKSSRHLYVGELAGKDLATWIKFWETREVERRPLSD